MYIWQENAFWSKSALLGKVWKESVLMNKKVPLQTRNCPIGQESTLLVGERKMKVWKGSVLITKKVPFWATKCPFWQESALLGKKVPKLAE